MSEGIHYNPFEVTHATSANTGEQIENLPIESSSKSIKIIAIVFLMFGVLGVSLSFLNFLAKVSQRSNLQGQSYDVYEEGPLVLMERNFISTFTASFSFVLSIAMLITAFGLLRKRGWATLAGVFVSLAAIIYKLIQCLGECYMIYRMFPFFSPGMGNPQGSYSRAPLAGVLFGCAMYTVFFIVPFLIFYSWTAFYLSRRRKQKQLMVAAT